MLARPLRNAAATRRRSCSGRARDGLCPRPALGVLPHFQDEAGEAVVAEVDEGRAGVAAPGPPRHSVASPPVATASLSCPTPPKVDWRTRCSEQGCAAFLEASPRLWPIDSHVVGVVKPEPRIFELALNALKTSPAECLHVGDSVRYDVVGAQAAGMTVVHIDPLELCDSGRPHPRGSLPSFVADLLGTAQASKPPAAGPAQLRPKCRSIASMRRRSSATSASRDLACSSWRRTRDDRSARSRTASSGTSRCGPWTPATIREGSRPAWYHDRSVERETLAAADASSKRHPAFLLRLGRELVEQLVPVDRRAVVGSRVVVASNRTASTGVTSTHPVHPIK